MWDLPRRRFLIHLLYVHRASVMKYAIPRWDSIFERFLPYLNHSKGAMQTPEVYIKI